MKLILTNINASRPQSLPAIVVLDTQKQNTFVLGRGSTQCDITISTSTTDRMISRRHCQFSYNAINGEWLFEDLNSLNGVFINQRKCNRTTVKDGDVVVFGGAYGLALGAKRAVNAETRPDNGDYEINTLAEYRITVPPPDEAHSQNVQMNDLTSVVPPPQSDSQSSLPHETNPRQISNSPTTHSPQHANILRTTSLPVSHDTTSTRSSLKRKSDQLNDINTSNTATMNQQSDDNAEHNKRHQAFEQSALADFAKQLEALREENKRLNDLLISQMANASTNELTAIITQQKLLWNQIKDIQEKENRITQQAPQAITAVTTAPQTTDADDDVQIIAAPPPSTANASSNESSPKPVTARSTSAAASTATAVSVTNSSGGAPMDDLRQKLRDEATCPVCHDLFNHPVTLSSCSHSFCKNCIDSWFTQGHDQCINCRAIVEVPPYSHSLPLANMVDNLLNDDERADRRAAAESAAKVAAVDKAKVQLISKTAAQLNKNQSLLSINDSWHQKDKNTFQEGLCAGDYHGHVRVAYCQLIGFTDAFINETTQIHILKKSCANLNISTDVKRDNLTVMSAKTAESRTIKELKRRLWFFLHYANIKPTT